MAARGETETQQEAALSDGLLDHLTRLNVRASPGEGPPWTSIACTVALSSARPDVLDEMLRSGMRVAVLDAAMGTRQERSTGIMMVRASAARLAQSSGAPVTVAVALDLRGGSVRTGVLPDGPATLRHGSQVMLTTDNCYEYDSDAETLFVDSENLADIVKMGDVVLLDDGCIRLRVVDVDAGNINCVVELGGTVGDHAYVAVPGVQLGSNNLTNDDLNDLRFAVEETVDAVMAPRVCDAASVKAVRDALASIGEHNAMVLAKIENAAGVENAAEIVAVADGVVVDRTALGVNMPPEKAFLAQKSIAALCIRQGKPAFCRVGTSTRADLSDIANAVLDGAEGIILGAETVSGPDPAASVVSAARVCREAEVASWTRRLLGEILFSVQLPTAPTVATAVGAVMQALMAKASAIVVLTVTGASARHIAGFRPRCSVVAVTRHFEVARKLGLRRAILPLTYARPQHDDWGVDTDLRFQFAIVEAKRRGSIRNGDAIVLVSGWRPGSGNTNKTRVMYA